MCGPQFLAVLGMGGGAAATAAGATAAAGAAAGGGLLSTIGTAIGVGGGVISAITGLQAGRAQAAALKQQAKTEAALASTEDARKRREYATAIAQQRAELAARGLSLESPSAIALGQSAAAEMSFDSQAIRSGAAARQQELSASAAMARAQGFSSLLKGTMSAAGSLLKGAPDLWPGLYD